DRASDAIILTNSQGYFLETNFQAEKLLGYSKEELQGMHLSQIYTSEALPIVKRKFNKLTEQAFLSGFNVDFLTKKGELIPVDISASVIEIQGERIIQSIARDVRDRLRDQEKLKQKNVELEYLLTLREEALQLREDMSNMIVHDLRNPLTSIILATSIAQKIIEIGDNPNLLTKKLETILSSSKRLQKMIDSLLLMAKLESGKLIFNPVPTDLYELGITVVADFELLLTMNKITLKSQLPPPETSMVVDEIILRRVIENLLSNALKFSPQGSQVTLILEYLPDNHLRIQVIDEGPGISPEKVQEIFKKFEIGTTKLNVSQIGLGLAFCKMVVEAQGGTINITPNQPKGSICCIEI
ncbi:MAG: PAS domain-containing sensor histidine kinase, partial [Microcystaceae cyanobacterium]